MIAIGQFLKTFGVNGLIKFRSYSGEVDHLSTVKRFHIGSMGGFCKDEKLPEGYEIDAWHIRSGAVVYCKIVGFDSPEHVQSFVGKDVYVPREQATQCKEGEYYISDLIGMRIMYDGAVLGTVTAVFTDAYVPLLEVSIVHDIATRGSKNTGASVKKIVPFMRQFVSEPVKIVHNDVTCAKGASLYAIELYDMSLLELG